jgi:signal peptidase II
MEKLASLVRGPLFWTGIAIVVADQITKALVRARVPLHDQVEVIPGLLNITHVLNTGAAFGILNAAEFPLKPVVVTILATAALVAIGSYAFMFGSETRLSRLSLMLILAGACGNLIDRGVSGAVVDFVDVYWRNWHFWTFNVADAAITCGAVLLLLDMFRTGKHVPSPA